MTDTEKLQKLRDLMEEQGLAGLLVPRTDEYQEHGDRLADYAERLQWFTGFTGSAGLAVILKDRAMVMTDSRYTIQLKQQVSNQLYSFENSQKIKPEHWLIENTSKQGVIGYDPKLHTPSQIEEYKKVGVNIKPVSENLIDKIWEDQPKPPQAKVSLFPEKISGMSASDKIKNLQETLKQEGADAVILTLLDSIAWLFNVRGNDIPHIPVVMSYAIIPVQGKPQWFVDPDKMTDEVGKYLEGVIDLKDPDLLAQSLESLGKNNKTVWLDTKRSSIWFKNELEVYGAAILEKDDPCITPRACKNNDEQASMKKAHIRDGVALVKFLKWFEESAPKEELTELSVEAQLESFRKEASEFREPSFTTIAGYAANGAIVHYRATETTSKHIELGNLLLLDSGAQYEDGTTDITRTMAVGQPTEEMRERNTLVLKGHIALANARFQKGTEGKDLDKLARQFLQEQDLDYAHGTGHGVGCYLSVHEEAAMGISPRSEKPLKPGMILSNEPGYYKEGAYGIRIENLILTHEDKNGELYFETITLAPIDKSLIVRGMLSENEKKWLNEYHAQVYRTLAPLLDSKTSVWLKNATTEV